ncbi:ubiquitin-conjugating enzyme E2Q-like protein CG4502 [Cylas formicarius]|uniref:ubiquitin-conjugating enzyme E2Q-like protein CG4502 n=1 Tax=Cylas formicarius TaxID=197179 RepID=UPI002958CB7B|nr:ubiquitin-conjugating enzyme E2Q-like protein CG4502 [Cylas formicarius]
MNVKPKERVTAVFRRIFKLTNKNEVRKTKGAESDSPARRFLRGYRDTVSPASSSQQASSTSFGAKDNNKTEEGAHNKTVRARRLMKEFHDLQRICKSKTDPVFTVELIDDNLFEWYVKLYKLDDDSELMGDMTELGIRYILLHLVFPENFPFAPPFVRVISPRIEKGFVMEGGAICMELLTPRGWASAYTVEAVIMQFAASVVKGQGRIQRKNKGLKVFNKKMAEESFRSLVRTHDKYGWVTPSLSDG